MTYQNVMRFQYITQQNFVKSLRIGILDVESRGAKAMRGKVEKRILAKYSGWRSRLRLQSFGSSSEPRLVVASANEKATLASLLHCPRFQPGSSRSPSYSRSPSQATGDPESSKVLFSLFLWT